MLLRGVRPRTCLLMEEDRLCSGGREAEGPWGTVLGQALTRRVTLSFSKVAWEVDAGTPIYTYTRTLVLGDNDTTCS